MTKEELEELEKRRDTYKADLKSLNTYMTELKKQLATAMEKWETAYKEFSFLDRLIAERTKVTVVKSTYSPHPPSSMTSKMAKELLLALGVPLEVEEKPFPEDTDEDTVEDDLIDDLVALDQEML